MKHPTASKTISDRWAAWVTTRWRWVMMGWLLLAIVLRLSAPAWNDVAYDGDFDYLPPEMSSVAGGRLLDAAFPGERSRSQIVLVVGRDAAPLVKSDQMVGLDLLRRLYHRLGEVSWRRAIERGYSGGMPDQNSEWSPWVEQALDALDHSIAADEQFYELLADQVPADEPTPFEPRMAIAHYDRGKLLEMCGEDEAKIGDDFEAALVLMPSLPTVVKPIEQRDLQGWMSMLDVLSWQHPLLGSRLESKGARLAVIQLSTELAATENIETIEAVDQLIQSVLQYSGRFTEPGLQLLKTGSAAFGGESLIASRDAIKYTEWMTVLMILVILALVYRSPLLVAVPMISIGFAVAVSTSLVSLLTDWSIRGTVPGLDLRIFTTSRIFIVVILFGAGTDYCLFLIARLREESSQSDWLTACRNSLSNVSGALLGSALTTVVGLGMLWIARFGKFHHTGPVIAICLLVGLAVCMSLTPALLAAIGPLAFWPQKIVPQQSNSRSLFGGTSNENLAQRTGRWGWMALLLTRYPIATLVIGFALLLIPGWYGLTHENDVTYDLSSQLNHAADSRRGLRLLAQHFDIGEINPITVLLLRQNDTDADVSKEQTKQLSAALYAIPRVSTVRTLDDPFGDFPPERNMGLLSGDAWKRRMLRHHKTAQRYFRSPDPAYSQRLTRLEVIVNGDPFSVETAAIVQRIEDEIAITIDNSIPQLQAARVLLTGATPSIMDLRSVTLQDNRRIKVAVVMAVFVVLLLVIRRVRLCLYLIATVLLSYYATLGLTQWFFRAAYGSDWVGLDWKLPLFLFVILVAVGQDYNVYLVTRIVEEQRRLGWLMGLRRAITRTGGIITACGLVMAATFFSMTASAWLPQVATALGLNPGSGTSIRGIVELGFALGLGVLIDTFYVRTILVPSFVTLLGKPPANR
jgi:RND superfamily putative drug exporter